MSCECEQTYNEVTKLFKKSYEKYQSANSISSVETEISSTLNNLENYCSKLETEICDCTTNNKLYSLNKLIKNHFNALRKVETKIAPSLNKNAYILIGNMLGYKV
ncbi:hypothetical protein HON01_02350 [Candidatus Woesearchaeota archaeon]|jgi:hypothetical protein|nr:hypothetical protein [Candidatus Woesearchaeota archaeon]MBT7367913.1 hypothetical protein [Candidatus Woesearchaeota archaeon]